MACIVRLVPSAAPENMNLLSSRRWLSKLRSVISEGSSRRSSSTAPAEEMSFDEQEREKQRAAEEARINKIRNVSRLRPSDRNMVHRLVPFEEECYPAHYTVRYKKRMFGRYGYSSGVDPGLCWPTAAELEDMKEYERVAYPYSIMEVAEREAKKKAEKETRKWERDEQVASGVLQMLKMKQEFLKKIEKQKQEADTAKALRTRLIEEVRLHFNYTLSERDERFRLEVQERAKQIKDKEKQEKKAQKKATAAMEKVAKFEEATRKLEEKEKQKKAAANKEKQNV